ncbi:MAG: 1-phosphofructokinase family hexose kinase [bacterium]
MSLVVTVTFNPAIDISCTVDTVAPDAKLRAGEVRREPGGGGINVARVVHRLGGDVEALYLAGGPTGDMLEKLLSDEEVPQRRVPVEGTTRESLTVHEASSTRQYRFVMSGAPLRQEEWEQGLAQAIGDGSGPAYLVASGSLPPQAPTTLYATLAKRARQAGIRAVVDTSGEPLRAATQAGVFLLKPNLRELGHLAGRELRDEADIEGVCRGLVEAGRATVVVTSLGAGGVILVAEGITDHIPTPTVPVRSKIGAGDSMVAGIVFGLAQGRDVPQAVRLGIAAGAAAVTTPGTNLCTGEDTLRLYHQMAQ